MNEAFTTHSRVPAPVNFLLGLLGGAVGGFLGYLGFVWLLKQGFYAVALPGVLLGLFAGLLAPGRSPSSAACSRSVSDYLPNGNTAPSSPTRASTTSSNTSAI